MKKTNVLAATLAASFLLATGASAQGFSFSYGATLTTHYISRGSTQSDDGSAYLALQPWAEVESGGFYGGLWASNVRFAPDRFELNLYGGYRWEVGNTSFDAGYARYFYNNSGDLGGELFLLAEHDAGNVTLFGGLYLDPEDNLLPTDAHAGFSVGLFDAFDASATLGRATGASYGNVGVTYTINDNFDADIRYHRGAGEGARVAFSTNVNF
ncbi:MAG: hypothetical protein JJT95_07540 [Pararhodobacter sp.]|nr:hypothetical protein [Pararhodobacter sp.]